MKLKATLMTFAIVASIMSTGSVFAGCNACKAEDDESTTKPAPTSVQKPVKPATHTVKKVSKTTHSISTTTTNTTHMTPDEGKTDVALTPEPVQAPLPPKN